MSDDPPASAAEKHPVLLTETVCRPPGSGFAFRFGRSAPEPDADASPGLPSSTAIPLVLGVRDPANHHAPQLLFNTAAGTAPAPDELCWATQVWRSPSGTAEHSPDTGLQFELFQPLPALLDLSLVRRMPYHSREICIPALTGHFIVDNRLGNRPVEGLALLAEPGWRQLERHEPGTIGWGRGEVGVAAGFERAAAAAGAELHAVRTRLDAPFEEAEPDAAEACVGFAFTVPAGARRELHLAFGMHDHGRQAGQGTPAGTGATVSWSRAFFGGLEDVLEQALMEDGRIVHAARNQHAAFTELASELSAEDLATVLAAVRQPAARPILLQADRRKPDWPRVAFPLAEPDVETAGTVDTAETAALEHQFLNNALHPWVLRTVLEDTFVAATAPNPAHCLILAASTAAATRQHDWLARTTGGPEALAAFGGALKNNKSAPAEPAPIRWLAGLAAALLADGLGQSEAAAAYRQQAQAVATENQNPPAFEELLLPWTIAEYWQHLGTPVDLAPFDAWRSVMVEHGCASFNDCCRALGKRGGALGILLLGDRLIG